MRSEVISESAFDLPDSLPNFENLQKFRCIHRRLLPRRPGRDPPLEQFCTLYGKEHNLPDTLLLTPIVEPGSSLPYYHPTVTHLAFRYISSETPTLQIDVAPLLGTPTGPNERLYRTCLALLETLHRYGWGAMTNYKKRVLHDCLVPREQYQDLYLVMRERHKHLVDTWQEVTDPLKHVFEVSHFLNLSFITSSNIPVGYRHRHVPHSSMETNIRVFKYRGKYRGRSRGAVEILAPATWWFPGPRVSRLQVFSDSKLNSSKVWKWTLDPYSCLRGLHRIGDRPSRPYLMVSVPRTNESVPEGPRLRSNIG